MFKVNYNNTKTSNTFSWVSVVNFGLVNINWVLFSDYAGCTHKKDRKLFLTLQMLISSDQFSVILIEFCFMAMLNFILIKRITP